MYYDMEYSFHLRGLNPILTATSPSKQLSFNPYLFLPAMSIICRWCGERVGKSVGEFLTQMLGVPFMVILASPESRNTHSGHVGEPLDVGDANQKGVTGRAASWTGCVRME
jgi:hypothetical protein